MRDVAVVAVLVFALVAISEIAGQYLEAREAEACVALCRPSGWCALAEQEGPDEVAACYLTCRGEP